MMTLAERQKTLGSEVEPWNFHEMGLSLRGPALDGWLPFGLPHVTSTT